MVSRIELEREFRKWAKETGVLPNVFNVIGWLQDKGFLGQPS